MPIQAQQNATKIQFMINQPSEKSDDLGNGEEESSEFESVDISDEENSKEKEQQESSVEKPGSLANSLEFTPAVKKKSNFKKVKIRLN